jgi:hypothetical protein
VFVRWKSVMNDRRVRHHPAAFAHLICFPISFVSAVCMLYPVLASGASKTPPRQSALAATSGASDQVHAVRFHSSPMIVMPVAPLTPQSPGSQPVPATSNPFAVPPRNTPVIAPRRLNTEDLSDSDD